MADVFKIVIHDADEVGYWAEVPAIPGCATQGDTMRELLNICMKQSRAAFVPSGKIDHPIEILTPPLGE